MHRRYFEWFIKCSVFYDKTPPSHLVVCLPEGKIIPRLTQEQVETTTERSVPVFVKNAFPQIRVCVEP